MQTCSCDDIALQAREKAQDQGYRIYGHGITGFHMPGGRVCIGKRARCLCFGKFCERYLFQFTASGIPGKMVQRATVRAHKGVDTVGPAC